MKDYRNFVSPGVAIKAIKKGFPGRDAEKPSAEGTVFVPVPSSTLSLQAIPKYIPTIAEVCAWLEDTYNMDVYAVRMTNCEDIKYHYNIAAYFKDNVYNVWAFRIKSTGEKTYPTRGEAVNAGIEEVLSLIP